VPRAGGEGRHERVQAGDRRRHRQGRRHPGAVVASILRCDFYSLKISRDAGGERVRARPKILSAAPKDAAGKRVLVVDEICTSGDTLRIALNALRQVAARRGPDRDQPDQGRRLPPDFYALETAATVAFPWDRHILNDAGEIVVNPIYEGPARREEES
jgi:uncharacterized protein